MAINVEGLDISHNNDRIIWLQVPASYRFVFIKASQGAKFKDLRFEENRADAFATKRFIIPYHFVTADAVETQLANFTAAAKLKQGSVTMLDWEHNPELPPLGILETLIVRLFALTGRMPVIYHGIYDLVSPQVNTCPWFVPKWGPVPQSKIKWLFWQNTNKAHIPGIYEPCDHDFFNGTMQDLELWYDLGKMPTGIKTLPPKMETSNE